MSARCYVRCPWCLGVAALDGERPADNLTCGACGSHVEVMGRVEGDHLHVGERCPCDDRCTGALGPLCSCRCGGKNHGGGLAADIAVIAGIPTLRQLHHADAERARSQRERYEAAVNALCEHPAYRRKCDGGYLPQDEFGAYIEIRRKLGRLHRITSLRSFAGRERALAQATS